MTTLLEQFKQVADTLSSDETTELLDMLKGMTIKYPDNTELKDAVEEFEKSLNWSGKEIFFGKLYIWLTTLW